MKSLLIFAGVITASSAHADPSVVATAPRSTIAIDGIGVLPLGDYAHAATIGVGAAGRLEVPAGPGAVSARVGVIVHAGGDAGAAQLTFVPVYAGYRIPLGAFYIAGELGITEMFGSVDTPLGRMGTSEAKLGLSATAGIRRGSLDLRAGLYAPDVGQAIAVIASAGFDIASL